MSKLKLFEVSENGKKNFQHIIATGVVDAIECFESDNKFMGFSKIEKLRDIDAYNDIYKIDIDEYEASEHLYNDYGFIEITFKAERFLEKTRN